MREIFFRGRDFSGFLNSWIFGSLDTTENEYTIMIQPDRFGNKCRIFVDPKTVGQFTGLTDKNGKKIFEGDIVERFWLGEKHIYLIDYDNGIASFVGKDICSENFTTFDYDACMFEVIGNIHDNPELLEVEE